jgi:hypothetical protein
MRANAGGGAVVNPQNKLCPGIFIEDIYGKKKEKGGKFTPQTTFLTAVAGVGLWAYAVTGWV